MFRFASPIWLACALIIPAAIYYRKKHEIRPVMGISSLAHTRDLSPSLAMRFRRLVPALKYTAFLLMIVAMARPQWGTEQTEILTEGINIVLAVDLSESMAALDFKKEGKVLNRLEAVKDVVKDFISKRNGDRIGMVVFGDHAYTQLPLTRDYQAIGFVLERLQIGAAGKRTAMGDAVGICLKRLEDIESKSNIIIILTDGRSNSGELSPDTAAAIAREKGVKIYTIGVGTRGKAPFLVKDIFGERYVYQRVDIDEDTLQRLAKETGGLYFRAENLEGLQKIYETIDKEERTEVRVKTFAEYKEWYRYLLIPALALLCAWVVLINTRFLDIP